MESEKTAEVSEQISQHEQSSHQENIPPALDYDHENVRAGYWRSWRFIGSVTAIVLMANSLYFGYILPASVLTVINNDLGPSPHYTLISLTKTLVGGVCLLIVGRISDIVGRRWFLIGGQAIGLIGSIVCALATSVDMVIGGTVLAGIAGAVETLYPLLIQEIVPNKYRGWGQAAITLGVFPTIGFGPIIARTLVAKTALSWRWCYWMNVVCAGLSIVLLVLCYFPPNFHELQQNMTKMQELQRIDYGGLSLYSAGLILILLGFSWTTGTYPWKSAQVISCVTVGFLLLVAFALYEIYMPLKQPLLPVKMLKNRNFIAACIVGTVGQMVYYALNVLWPQQITALYTTDNITIGWMASTTGASLAVGEIVCGPLFKLVGRARLQIILSSIGVATFAGMMAAATQYNKSLAIAGTIATGFSVGWVELACSIVSGLVIPPDQIGVAIAFFSSMRAVLGTIATAIYVSIYSNELAINLPGKITPAVLDAGLPQSSIPLLFAAMTNGTSTALRAVPGINSTIISVFTDAKSTAYSSSFKTVYLASLSFGLLSVIVSFFASDVDHLLTNFVNKTVSQEQRVISKQVADVEA